jgi:alkenylglycerophosphocholine hydrolase
MKTTKQVLLLSFWIVGAVYIGLIDWVPFPGSMLVKAFPIWCLAALAYKNVAGITGKLLTLGFLLSSVGDIALTWNAELAFMIGLGFFLLAHVTYIVVFSRKIKWDVRRIPFFLFAIGAGITMSILLGPHLGAMAVPVYIYLTVITIMVLFSGLRTEVSPLLMLGALTFMVSDAMIAVHKFLQPFPGAKHGIMITYYLAQFLIVWAFMRPLAASQMHISGK